MLQVKIEVTDLLWLSACGNVFVQGASASGFVMTRTAFLNRQEAAVSNNDCKMSISHLLCYLVLYTSQVVCCHFILCYALRGRRWRHSGIHAASYVGAFCVVQLGFIRLHNPPVVFTNNRNKYCRFTRSQTCLLVIGAHTCFLCLFSHASVSAQSFPHEGFNIPLALSVVTFLIRTQIFFFFPVLSKSQFVCY